MSVAHILQHLKLRWLVNNELERVAKETVVAYLYFSPAFVWRE